MRINKLDDTTIKLIAAGEVIERPASCVKELIDNSIDAGADIIKISLSMGGLKSIKIQDNGRGILKEDLMFALDRHATSKISRFDDLENLTTLGFRGEALASMECVSNISIASKPKEVEDNCGYSISSRFGERDSTLYPVSIPEGTLITIEDLFFNVPARKKVLKTPTAELAAITEVVMKFAMAHPEIRFHLSNNSKTVLSTNGDGVMPNTIFSLFGKEVSRNTIPIEFQKDGIVLTGIITTPNGCKKTKKYQTLTINKRIIENKNLRKAVEKGYIGFIPPGIYPVYCLDISMDVSMVDPNSHPSKKEVKCSNDTLLEELIIEAIQTAFSNSRKQELSEALNQQYNKFGLCIDPSSLNDQDDKVTVSDRAENFIDTDTLASMKHSYTVIGQLFDTYIQVIVGDNEKVLFIDQHAVHEMVIYKKIKEGMLDRSVSSVSLNIPATLKLTPTQFNSLHEKQMELINLGFSIEEFGSDTVIIRSVPVGLENSKIKDVVEEILDGEQGVNWLDRTLIMLSCKGAIKANTPLELSEQKALVEFFFTEEVTNCPHGRPAFRIVKRTELEKEFKRIL